MAEPTPPPTAIERVTRWIQDNALVVGIVAVVALVAAVAMGVALATGGSGTTAAPDDETTTTTTEVDGTTAPTDSPPPTTGTSAPPTPIENPSALVAIKIDNADRARPQVGLDNAPYLFEVPAEGGITRFLGFFEAGTDSLVGPVRSARPVDVDLVGVLSSTLVSTGGRPFVLGALTGNGISLIGADPADSPFQALERPAPHHLFIALADLAAPEPVEFGLPDADFPSSGRETTTVEIPYATPVTWTYSDGVYTRSQGGEEFLILPDWDEDPVPLTADTVVVMEVNSRSAGYQDGNGAEVPTYDVIGSGPIEVHSGGVAVTGTWSRASLADPYSFEADGGEQFGFPPGRTFIHLVP
jgi:hypothetical protein